MSVKARRLSDEREMALEATGLFHWVCINILSMAFFFESNMGEFAMR